MQFPEGLYYTKDHEWIKVEGDTGTIGITDFAQSELGDIVYVEVDTMDESVAQDDVFGTVEAVKTVSELFMPISGTVTAFNEDLEDSPETVNEDPYGAGWLIRITIEDASQLDGLLSASDYAEMVGK
ncbi:MAG: glycine cleavage system protein GcvH [Bacteroidetes bacterium]|nr:glycine cleavage system protein GcvH [Bacteroidota bacterium]MDA1332621.1 glycine cleavage system protein GcvH [Bacteroidota bacterium]